MHWGLILSGVCFELGVCSTCVSVRRRGRYTCTPNSFCVSCLVLLHAPPIFCPHLVVPPSGPAHCASQLLCLCCPPPPCLSCASLDVLPCGGSCDCAVFVLLRARRFSWFLRSSLCLCGLCCFPCCLPSSVVVPVCPFCLPCPAGGLVCALVQLAPRCAGASLWVSVASVTALLPCFMLGVWLSFAILPSFGSWQQRLLALCGVFTLYTMSLVTSGSLVWPY